MSTKAKPSERKAARAKDSRGDSSLAAVCEVKDCGRPHYARGYCQTHHRQVLKTGKVSAIRPYRARNSGNEKFAGLRLSPGTVDALIVIAKRERISYGAAIAKTLEEWNANGHPRLKRPPR